MELRVGIERALEEGRFGGRGFRLASSAWSALATRTIARPLDLPNVPVVCVGGATLGGSGKTTVAIAYARKLVDDGARVVFVGHAYGARPLRARKVAPSDDLAVVGDEALLAARAGLEVVVGPDRSSAVELAARLAPDVLVIDGPLTTRPRPPALSILALDREAPWGSGLVVPLGDLRAPQTTLTSLAGAIVTVDATPRANDLAALRGRRIGLVTAIARPHRLRAALEKAGVVPAEVIRLPDHFVGGRSGLGRSKASFDKLRRPGKNSIDAWVTTQKCALHIESCLGPKDLCERLVVLPSPTVDVGILPTPATLVALTLRTFR